MDILRYRKLYFLLSGLLLGASVASIVFFSLRLGIDFTGGSIMEVAYSNGRPSTQEIQKVLQGVELGSVQIQPLGETNILLRMKDIPESVHQQVLSLLGTQGSELRFESIGPVIGKELARKTLVIIVLSLLVIVAYIALAFRKIANPVRPWHWSLASLLALVHDLLLPLGVLAYLSSTQGMEFTIPVVVALLTVVGYSINNNIVVFDRVRENIFKRKGSPLEDTVNMSIKETFSRNMATSLTTLFPLLAIFFFGGESLKPFSLVLSIGIATSLYTSLLFSPAFLVRLFSPKIVDKRL